MTATARLAHLLLMALLAAGAGTVLPLALR